jgi:hypothetical protein
VYLGNTDLTQREGYNGWNSWIFEYKDSFGGDLHTNPFGIYVYSAYFVWTIFTTVGYGDYYT